MTPEPLVSIVMPVYNAARWLKRPVESVVAQTHPTWELLAVDDGSRDESVALLEAYADQDDRIRVLRQPQNGGVAAARKGWLRREDILNTRPLDAVRAWLAARAGR